MRVNRDNFNVRDAFLALTRYTVPYGWEEEMYEDVLRDYEFEPDGLGNFILQIGDAHTIFAAHMDTAGGGTSPKRIKRRTFKRGARHMIDVQPGAWTVLGADDRAGMTVLLNLIEHNVPGYYWLFAGEEAGRIGSTDAASNYGDMIERWGIERVIQWDRRGTSSIITHQMSKRGVSSEFVKALSEAYATHGLALSPDDGGSYTDSYSFYDLVPECVNISAGYTSEHTSAEAQDMSFLEHMAAASVSVDWEALPTAQDPLDREYGWHSTRIRRSSYASRVYTTGGYAYDGDFVTRQELFDLSREGRLTQNHTDAFTFNDPDAASELLFDLLDVISAKARKEAKERRAKPGYVLEDGPPFEMAGAD